MGKRKKKILRVCTVSNSIGFMTGIFPELVDEGFEVGVVASPGEFWRDLDFMGDKATRHPIAMERRIAPLKDLVSLFMLIKLFLREKPAMVHSMTPKAGMLSMLAAWLTRVPVRVHTFTGLVFPTATGLKRRLLMATDWLTCACATHVIPEGEGVKNDLLNNGITHKPMRVLGNGSCIGIDLEHFDRTPEVMEQAAKLRKDGVFTYVFVGRLMRDKGVNELIEAFKAVNKLFPDTRLVLVGRTEQDLDPVLPETIKEIENNSSIEAVGWTDDVRPWLAAADALVFPSYREGFPNVVLEAGAMGLPSIVTDINGSREIIKPGLNGSIVAPRDAKDLFGTMHVWVYEKKIPAIMSKRARQHIADHYSRDYVRACLLEYYHEILSHV